MRQRIRTRLLRSGSLWVVAAVLPLSGAMRPVVAAEPSAAVLAQKLYDMPGFAEPLVPTRPTARSQDEALIRAVRRYSAQKDLGHVAGLQAYLRRYPHSPWTAAIKLNEGLIAETRGYYDRALVDLAQAWRQGRSARGQAARSQADYAVASLARLEARFADKGALARLLRSVRGRGMTGPSAALLAGVREAFWDMQHIPQTAFRCGPMALKAVLTDLYPRRPENTKLCITPVTEKGLSLSAMQKLARTVGLTYVMARPTPQARFPIPAVVHWRVNHYATLVAYRDGRYGVRDPAFNHEQWFTRRALLHETTAVLIPPRALAHGFVPIRARAGARIWGRGYTGGNDLNATTHYDKKVHPPGQPRKHCKARSHSCKCTGLARYSVSAMLVSLSISDTPLAYTPPLGPRVAVTFTYNADDVTQPANFTFGNVGPQWTTNWSSYIEEPLDPYSDVFRVFPGGGGETETTAQIVGPDAITYAPEPLTGAQLFKIGPAAFKRVLPNGTVQIYDNAAAVSGYTRRVFLTSITGPRGHTVTLHYDSQFRLTSITDPLGQVTTFRYADPQYPLQVTSVTDPFGRTATLTYDGEGRLTSTTDPLGMTSRYTYSGTGTTITGLTTPYGTTHFQSAIVGDMRLLTVTDPLGHTEKMEYIQGVSSIPFYDAHPPAGMALFTSNMNDRDTYVWNPDVYAQAPSDFTKATIYHWLHSQVGLTSRVLESIKHPLQNWLWYSYPNQFWVGGVGTLDKPSAIGVQLGDGKTDLTTLARNATGHVIERVGPDGHTTFISYAANGIDPITVSQQTPQGPVVVARATYNAQHEPLTTTNAAGETTTYTYNAAGQLTSKTNPLGETTRYVYDASGYLSTIVNANGQPQARFTYDSEGRVASYTNAGGTTVRYTYDALNRLTGITYPDGTTRTYTYQNLNVVAVKNRLNQITRYGYDADGRLISITNPTGAVTTLTRNADEKVIAITDPDGHTTDWMRDIEERVIGRTGPLQHVTTWTYGTGAGRLQGVTDPLGQTTAYGYTLGGKLASLQYLHAQVPTPGVIFTYGASFPHLIAMTDGTGTTHYAYGSVGAPGALRLTTVQTPLPQATIRYAYDANDDLIHQSINGQTQTFGYDALGRLTGDTNALGAFTYGYLGQTALVTSQRLAGSPVAIRYRYLSPTHDDRLQAILNTVARGQPPASFSYRTNALDEITRIQARPVIPGGGRSPRPRDRNEGDSAGFRLFAPVDHPTDALFGGEGEEHEGRSLGPGPGYGGPVGAFLGVASLTYDADQRLVGTTGNLFGRTRYTYDAANNLLAVHNSRRPFTGYYNAANELIAASGRTLTYNADGELTNDGARTYTWDAAYRLVAVRDGTGTITTFAYNGLDERVATITQAGQAAPVTTDTLWCGITICAAFTPSGTLTAQYFPQGEIDGRQEYLYTRNTVGSVTATLTPQGTVVRQYNYSPFGQAIVTGADQPVEGRHRPRHGAPTPTFGYAGMVYNASTGLNLTLYRAYDARLRRWLSRDPVGMMSGLALIRAGLMAPGAVAGGGASWVGLNLAINRYPYVGNDPLNWGDPEGDIQFSPWVRNCAIGVCIVTRLACVVTNRNPGPEIEPAEPQPPPVIYILPRKSP